MTVAPEDSLRILLVVHPKSPPSLADALQPPAGAGFEVETVVGAARGLDRLARGGFAAILFDLTQEDLETWDSLGRLFTAAASLPILAVSAHQDDAVATKALRAGAQEYLWPGRFAGGQLEHAIRFAIERHRIVRERQSTLDRLRELERFKTQFINTAAHELNSPLTPVRLQLHLLKNTHSKGITEAQARSLSIVDRNVERLITLVGDILEAARLQANRLVVKKEPLDLAQVVTEAVDSMQATAAAAHIDLKLTRPPAMPVDADADRIAQVVYNLIGNALKFTPAGGKVRVRTEKTDELATVRVEDTGIGLRPEDFQRLFQPFSQTHDWVPDKKPGSGLGLYISQGIIEQHGGRIWCDSPGPNKGSAFSFALPIHKSASLPTVVGTAPAPKLRRVRRGGIWPVLYFKCPTCGSRDINMRILKNKYECRACTDEWQ